MRLKPERGGGSILVHLTAMRRFQVRIWLPSPRQTCACSIVEHLITVQQSGVRFRPFPSPRQTVCIQTVYCSAPNFNAAVPCSTPTPSQPAAYCVCSIVVYLMQCISPRFESGPSPGQTRFLGGLPPGGYSMYSELASEV